MRLTEQEYHEMMALRAEGWTLAVLAKHFNTSYQSVQRYAS